MRLRVDEGAVFAATGGRPFDPALPALLFLHGAGMDHTVWALQTRYFAHRGRTVMAPDLPGHGRSDGPVRDSVVGLADWVIGLMDAAGIETAALVGHSMGALAALEAAARRPDRIDALALLAVNETMQVHPDLMAAARDGKPLAVDLITAWGHGRRAHMGGNPAPGLWLMGGDQRLLERGMAALATDLAICDGYAGARAAAAKLACETLFVLGRLDRMTPAAGGHALAAAVAEAIVVELPGAGHLMMVEDPGGTQDALKAFLGASPKTFGGRLSAIG
jgi:pimeloyl-ACP methyl ester carboxylesterase